MKEHKDEQKKEDKDSFRAEDYSFKDNEPSEFPSFGNVDEFTQMVAMFQNEFSFITAQEPREVEALFSFSHDNSEFSAFDINNQDTPYFGLDPLSKIKASAPSIELDNDKDEIKKLSKEIKEKKELARMINNSEAVRKKIEALRQATQDGTPPLCRRKQVRFSAPDVEKMEGRHSYEEGSSGSQQKEKNLPEEYSFSPIHEFISDDDCDIQLNDKEIIEYTEALARFEKAEGIAKMISPPKELIEEYKKNRVKEQEPRESSLEPNKIITDSSIFRGSNDVKQAFNTPAFKTPAFNTPAFTNRGSSLDSGLENTKSSAESFKTAFQSNSALSVNTTEIKEEVKEEEVIEDDLRSKYGNSTRSGVKTSADLAEEYAYLSHEFMENNDPGFERIFLEDLHEEGYESADDQIHIIPTPANQRVNILGVELIPLNERISASEGLELSPRSIKYKTMFYERTGVTEISQKVVPQWALDRKLLGKISLEQVAGEYSDYVFGELEPVRSFPLEDIFPEISQADQARGSSARWSAFSTPARLSETSPEKKLGSARRLFSNGEEGWLDKK